MRLNSYRQIIDKINSSIISHNMQIELEITTEDQLVMDIIGNDRFGFTHSLTAVITDEFLSKVDGVKPYFYLVRDIARDHFDEFMQTILDANNMEEFTPFREKILYRANGVIAVDLDGTICSIESDYSKCKLLPDVLDTLNWLKEKGSYIAIHTARQLEDYKVTMKWLKDNRVPFDFISMGKLKAGLYVDDKSFNPINGISAMKKIYGDLK